MEKYIEDEGEWTAFIQRIYCNQWPPKALLGGLYNIASAFTILTHDHTFTHILHTPTAVSAMQGSQPARLEQSG